MNRTRMIAAAGLAALTTGVVASSAVAAPAAGGKLVASVSDPLNISLTSGGKKVTSLKAGAYTITVKDKASDHNFHLTGPGVNKSTAVAAKGTYTWKVTLKKGTYKYVCDPHKSFMKGSFTVK
jgi:plastocyanin